MELNLADSILLILQNLLTYILCCALYNIWISEYFVALTYYNEAVLWAENECQELAMALANRAFVWMKLKRYLYAKNDLELVIKSEYYPIETLYKIHQRLGNVYQYLGEQEKSIDQFRKAIDSLKNTNLPNNQKSKFNEDIQNSLETVKRMHISFKNNKVVEDILKVEFEHEQILDVSKKLQVQHSDQKGRYSIGK